MYDSSLKYCEMLIKDMDDAIAAHPEDTATALIQCTREIVRKIKRWIEADIALMRTKEGHANEVAGLTGQEGK